MAETPFPDGNSTAVVTSWDDGAASDAILHRMLEQYGYKGTFYICAEHIGKEGYLDADALRRLLADGHEIGSQSLNHPRLETLSPAELRQQLMESKAKLEALTDKPVPSFAYPFGLEAGQEAIVEAVRAAGYASARTTHTVPLLTADSLAAGDWMQMPVAAYFTDSFLDVQEKWDAVQEQEGGIFHLWGHSHKLGKYPDEWVDFECILGFLGGVSNVWYCTVGELVAHLSRCTT